ncbi:MAG: hypothetical protein KIS94_01850 [Chitinophagales bacterium]|nr:hypothetical protein [Chitinophagales bacterium]
MQGVVVYKSRYGAAKQYALWLAEALNIPALTEKEADETALRHCNYIIAGSSIYMGKIMLKDWLTKNTGLLKNKKIFLFIVGAAPPEQTEKTRQYFSDNIPADLLQQSSCFYLQGKSIFSELSWLDKLLLKAGAHFAPTPEDKKAMLTDFNAINKHNLNELLSAVKQLQQ